MFLILVYFHIVQVLSEAPPAPPQNVHVDNWLLTWTPAKEERNVTYTVQYSSFDTNEWKDVPACVQIPLNSCNVTFTKAYGEHGCVMLHVQAERQLLASRPVEACSRHGDSCTPEVSLSVRPGGSLTVHLSRNHLLALEHGDHAKHRVYYGKEGEPLEKFEDAAASVTIHKLQEGQRYCAEVQYIYFDEPVGLPSCTQCELIPESKAAVKQTEKFVAVGVVIVLAVLVPVIAYMLIYQRGRIKKWLRPPYRISDDFLLEPFSQHHSPIFTSGSSQEHCDVITCVTPKELRE